MARPTTPDAAASIAPQLRRRACEVAHILAQLYPDAHCELDFATPLQLLEATVLSAQCTDVRVNQVTPALWVRYPDATAIAQAAPAEVEEIIRPTGFFRAKAAHLIGIGQELLERFDGQVPRTMAELTSLPGVGRKTANVVLGNAFAVPGLPVDTHVGRVARRLELTRATDPVAVEADLCALYPPQEWTMLSHRLIFHGRRVCHSRKPACEACALRALCPSAGPLPAHRVGRTTRVEA